MMTVKEIRNAIENRPARSAWSRAIKEYAAELLDNLDPNQEYTWNSHTAEELLNGAGSWNQYSWGGSSLIYNWDIARRTCSPSELKKTRDGDRRPNAREEWLDVQARALYQASRMIRDVLSTGR